MLLLVILAAGAGGWAGACLVLDRAVPAPARALGALVAGQLLLLGIFQPLGAAGAFTPGLALGTLALLAAGLVAAAGPAALRSQLRQDLGSLGTLLREVLTPASAGLGAAVSLQLGLTLARSLLLPPYSWDGLRYHLPLAAGFVQEAGWFRWRMPDLWTAYQFYPQGSEVLMAWTMLATGSDAAVALVPLGAVLMVLLAGLGLGRRLGLSPADALTGALLLVATPFAVAAAGQPDADLVLLGQVMAGAHFLLEARASGRGGEAALALGALGLAAGTKISALPLVALAPLLLVRRVRPAGVAVGLGAALVVAGPWFLQSARQHGSPFFPFPVRVLGVELSKAAPALQRMSDDMNAMLAEALGEDPWLEVFASAELASLERGALGPTLLVGLLLLPFGLRRLRRAGRLEDALVLLVLAAPMVLGYLQPSIRGARLRYGAGFARLLAYPGAAVLLVGLAGLPPLGRGPRAAWLRRGLALVGGLGLCGFGPWGNLDPAAPAAFSLLVLGLLLLPPGAVRGALVLMPRRGAHLVALACAYAALLGLAGPRRQAARYQAYARIPEIQRFLPRAPALWERLDDPAQPRRVAVTAGYGMDGLNWVLFPLFGRALQNRVGYVPVTGDGRLLSYADPAAVVRAVDREAWLARLRGGGYQVLVCLPPESVERYLARSLPGVLVPEETGEPQAYGVSAKTTTRSNP